MSYVALPLGALERRNPLPVGRYSYTAIPEGSGLTNPTGPPFNEWLTANRSTVKVLATAATVIDGRTQDHVVFDVKSPTSWDAVKLGFPNAEAADGDPGDIIHREKGGDGDMYWWDWLAEKLTPPTKEEEEKKKRDYAFGIAALLAGLYILKTLPDMMEKRKAASK